MMCWTSGTAGPWNGIRARNGWARGSRVLLIDLDDFKEVNDILGHQAGDDMLVEVARRLRGCVPNADVVARLGGDEFVVLLTACPDAKAIAACIVRCLHVPVTINGTVLRPSLSLGLAPIGKEAIRTGQERLPILSSMINMAHSLSLTVTAEGVETAVQADYLTPLDCDSLQGYLFSLPEAGRQAEDALAALAARRPNTG